MTINEYRKNHKRCRTCEYAYYNNTSWYCRAKMKRYHGVLSYSNMQGCFCKLYKPTKEKEQ